MGMLALLLAVAALVIFILPQWVAERDAPRFADKADDDVGQQSRQPVSETPVIVMPVDVAQAALQKQAAERELGETLRRLAALEAQDAAQWGGAEYVAALEQLRSADTLFSSGKFLQATQVYLEVRAALDALDASRPERLRVALERGLLALEGGDGDAARQQFGIALAIDPDNENAQVGFNRAQTIAQVTALFDSGKAHEQSGSLALAKADFEHALGLDGLFVPARTALSRVTGKLAALAFQDAMSRALEALARLDFKAARDALNQAGRLKPNAAEVQQTAARLQAGEQLQRLEQLHLQAMALEAKEQWRAAAAQYAAALIVDPHVAFAIDGQRKSLDLAQLNDQVQRYVDQPQRLESAQPLANAHSVLQTARKLSHPGPLLTAKLASLEELVRLASAPVTVTFNSDGETDVTVYRVGNIGRFSQKSLPLKPGSYTAVGTRTGYRDERLEFRVKPGANELSVRIVCEERI